MQIESYFQQIQQLIAVCLSATSSNITYDKRSTYMGYIRGEIYFADDSVLHIREFVDVENSIERFTYSYHYMNDEQQLLFRYDNTGHHQKLNLPTYPHHKHEGTQDNIIPAPAATLALVLEEIEELLR